MSFPSEGLRSGECSPGGFRLYLAEDAERDARMQRGLDQGLSAGHAARAARASAPPSEELLDDAAERLLAAVRPYDERRDGALQETPRAAARPRAD